MADGRETLFDLPNAPEAFGVVLPSASLSRIDFSGLEFETARRACIEYIRTYYPNDFNDFVASNGIIMMIELVAAAVAKLSLRGDILANEGTLPTAQTEEAVINHLALINQRIRRQTPAVVDVECTVANPAFTDLRIPAGTSFQVRGGDGGQIGYEIYRAPGDFSSPIVIPAGKRGVIAYGVEGQFASPFSVVSAGGPDQLYKVPGAGALEWPLFLEVSSGRDSEQWTVTTEPLERFDPTAKVAEVTFIDDRMEFRFGNNVTGMAPLAGQRLTFRYRVGGGVRGRIGAGQLDAEAQLTAEAPANAPVQVHFRNPGPSSGGTDRESLAEAKRRAPKDYALRTGIVTDEDYAQAAKSFAHPAFGAIAKAVATIRTGRNANLIEIYCLAHGPDGVPVAPNAGLKLGLETYYGELNVCTDHVRVLDGLLCPVNVEMTVVISRSVDASVVKARVEQAITDFFALDAWEMGQPLYTSNLVEAVKRIDGVAYVDLFSPTDNLLAGTGVQFNQLIVEGQRLVKYYYERAIR